MHLRRVVEPFILRTVWLSLVAVLAIALVNRFTPDAPVEQVVPVVLAEPATEAPVDLNVTRLVARSTTTADGEKRLVIWGIVQNPVSANVHDLQVAVRVSDGKTIVATAEGAPAAKAVPAGGSLPFRLTVPMPAKWKATWPLSATAVGRTTDTPIAAMSLSNISTTTDAQKKIHVHGTVRNASDWATGDSLVWVTLLNPKGEVVTASWRSITQVIGPEDAHDVEIVIGPANGWSSIEVGVLDRFLTN